jgi:hypothetical protein
VDGPIVVARSDNGGEKDPDKSPPAIELSLCETSVGKSVSSPEGPALLDDFEDGDARFADNGRAGTWYNYGDDYGSFVNGTTLLASPGRGASQYALHSEGVDFTDWGSGMGATLANDSGGTCLHDLSAYTGITFWARGRVETTNEPNVIERDQGTVKLMLTEADVVPVDQGGGCDGTAGGCWDSHKGRFEPGECWNRFSFDFSELEPDGWGHDGGELDLDKMYNLGFEVGAYSDWELWVDDIGFYAGTKPADAEDCDVGEGYGGASGQL